MHLLKIIKSIYDERRVIKKSKHVRGPNGAWSVRSDWRKSNAESAGRYMAVNIYPSKDAARGNGWKQHYSYAALFKTFVHAYPDISQAIVDAHPYPLAPAPGIASEWTHLLPGLPELPELLPGLPSELLPGLPQQPRQQRLLPDDMLIDAMRIVDMLGPGSSRPPPPHTLHVLGPEREE